MKGNLIKAFEQFNKQSRSKKIQLIIALMLTIVVLITAPTLAWYSYQRRMITMSKINSPAKLTLKSGHREDIIQFKLSGIDVGEGEAGSEDFIFSVAGKDINKYKLQLAYTTNIGFNYSIYRAIENDAAGTVRYTAEDGSTVKYVKADFVLGNNGTNTAGTVINETTSNGRKIGTDGYENKSYNAGDERQDFAKPVYWQTGIIDSAAEYSGTSYNDYCGETGKDKEFLNYYVLHVEWDDSVTNDKETDIIYITAQVHK